ncbi:MAG: methyltransferase RsmF C-terminal domain-like protein [Chitinophagaceae bacterium]
MNLPEALLDSFHSCSGMDRDAFIGVHHEPPPVSIRFHPFKSDAVRKNIEINELIVDHVPWCPDGRYLSARPSFTLDTLYNAGAYYVQEASSMFIHHVASQLLENVENAAVLDMCAAPGGKSTLLSTLPQIRFVLANEIIQSRVPALVENAVKWGMEKLLVCNNDPKSFEQFGGYFDLVLVDAPCSGSGLFRKDPKAMNEWSPELPEFCSARQKRILASAMKAVKEDGFLIYSTCSYSPCENEENMDFILSSGQFQSVELKTYPDWRIMEESSPVHHAVGYRFFPHLVKGEGFFCAAFRRTASSESSEVVLRGTSSIKKLPDLIPWITEDASTVVWEWEGSLFLQHLDTLPHIELFRQALRIKRSGTRLGSYKRGDFIPDHELALCIHLSDEVSRIEVDRATAVRYLRKDPIELETGLDGWVCISYSGLALGWVKFANGRLKNHYPMTWRILMRN